MLGVILVGHDAGGKSTIASYVAEQFRSSYVVAFANALKQDLAGLGIPVWDKPYSKDVRDLLRQYGQTQMSLNDNQYWVNRTFEAMDESLDRLLDYEIDYPQVIICDDCRHHHELEAWVTRFPKHLIIVLTNNSNSNIDYSYRSVYEVQQIIEQVVDGRLPNSLVIENIHTANGLSEDIKQSIKESINGLSTHLSVTSVQL